MKPLLLALLLSSVVGLPPTEQRDSLLVLYESLGGPSWVKNTNWNVTTDPCDWHGVFCNGPRTKVVRLFFQEKDNNLRGTLPDLYLPDLVEM